MKLTEAEMRMVFQIESTNQNAALNEIYMTWRYAPNPATKETAEGLLDKLRPLSDQECMDLIRKVQAEYRLPEKARTIGEMLAEARQQSGAQKLSGHDIMALERFDPATRHMIVFDVLTHDSPVGWKGEKMRLFLTDAGYSKALENQEKGHIKMCYELIQLVTEKNNLHDVDTWMFFKWIFKTFCAVLIVTNTWNIVMGIFDVGQSVVNSSAGVIIGNTSIDISSVITDMEAQLEALGTGELFGLWFQSLFVGLTMNALSICIMLVIYGRMIEVYLTTSVGPIPLATMTNRDWSHTGQNYLKSLFALAFQAFLIMVCVGIYSVLVQSIATDGNISGAIWACMGYTVLLCFALFKTGSLSKSLFGAH